MEISIPKPLKVEHEELHAELAAATKVSGKIGEAAQSVAHILHPHFVKEEEYALPPLGLLSILAEGRLPQDIPAVIVMTNRLKADLSHMLHEHKAVIAALDKLMEAAENEKKPEIIRFGKKLKLHAQTEEQVLYPAAILIGEYLQLKIKGC
jgi:Hemerythrin HHE cation binding domain